MGESKGMDDGANRNRSVRPFSKRTGNCLGNGDFWIDKFALCKRLGSNGIAA